jgi:hypothetical protein
MNSDDSDRYYVVGEEYFARDDLSGVFSQIIHECILNNSANGELVNKLWQFCQSRYPDQYQAALLQADKEGSYLKNAPSFFMDQFDENSGENLFAVLIGLLNGSADAAVPSKDARLAKFRINSDDRDHYYVVRDAIFAQGDLSGVFSQIICDCEQESADELNTFWQFCQSRYPDQYQAALLQADKEGSYLKNAPGYFTDQFDDEDGEKLIKALFELLNASSDTAVQSKDDRPAKFKINRDDHDHYYVVGNTSFAREDLFFIHIWRECEKEGEDAVNKLWQVCETLFPSQYEAAEDHADGGGTHFKEDPVIFTDQFDDDDEENLITSVFELLNETKGATDTQNNEPDYSGLDPDEAQKTRALWEKLEKLSPEEQEEFKRAILGEPEVKSTS